MNIDDFFPSDYLTASDLKGQPRRVTIESVGAEQLDGKAKPLVRFTDVPKGLILNKTNKKAIARLYGTETSDWHGKPLEIYPTRVEYKGEEVDAIRVRGPGPAPQQAQQPAPAQAAPAEQQPAQAAAATDQPFNDDIPW